MNCVPVRLLMNARMAGKTENLQVLDSIVVVIPVQVVNRQSLSYAAANTRLLLDDLAVLASITGTALP